MLAVLIGTESGRAHTSKGTETEHTGLGSQTAMLQYHDHGFPSPAKVSKAYE